MSKYLLLIDFIADLVSHDPMASEIAHRSVLANAGIALAKARAAGIPVGHVKVAFSAPDLPEAPARSPLFGQFKGLGVLQIGSPGVEFAEAVAPIEGEAVIVKHQVSPFWKTTLDAELERHGVTELYLAGVSTALAISSAVREGHDRGLAVTVIEDACAAHSLAAHEAELEAFGRLCAVSSAEAIDFTA